MVVSEEIFGVCKHLDAVKALQEEHVMDVLSGLSMCTKKQFQSMFEKSTHPGHHFSDATSMEQIKAILDKAVDTYDNLCTAQV